MGFEGVGDEMCDEHDVSMHVAKEKWMRRIIRQFNRLPFFKFKSSVPWEKVGDSKVLFDDNLSPLTKTKTVCLSNYYSIQEIQKLGQKLIKILGSDGQCCDESLEVHLSQKTREGEGP